ncbi:hypothetical protein N2K95_03245 [Arthrobacter zhaoxinii]|uniref:LppA-like lipoprotein n=1 Tax=Arthrobacter zhaoxinii TaxID=2964616 RepID=A0ABY5YUP2_9MICC|nr:hypothetical protein [Arthrobacter zhaoxinii]UWX97714.1 hypothetical protein N2K95_03245 [Arthrobacter zhaoxinii]
MLTSVAAGLSGCAGGTEQLGDRSAPPSTDQTSRESYDEFVAQMDEILAVTGEPTGWTTEFGKPWGADMDTVLLPRVCDPDNWEDSPHRIQLTVVGPGTKDPQADRAAMIEYMKDQGMEITGLFGDPSYPDGVSWDASGIGQNGLEITYGTSSQSRVVTLHGECSSDPSMQESVSREAP